MTTDGSSRRRRVRAPRQGVAAAPVVATQPRATGLARRRGSLPTVDVKNLPDFKSLYFGRAAAEVEVAADPEKFRLTYLDQQGLPALVAAHQRFLILGPKGSGKSAAASFVAETWKHNLGASAVFASSVDFDELNRTQTPLASLDKRLVSSEVTTMTDAAWKVFIGVRLLESLLNDPVSGSPAVPVGMIVG